MDVVQSTPLDASRREAIDITFENRGDRLLGLGIFNGIMKILTLGLYGFWGKTEIRRRLWSFTRINGEPLAYTGTGKELFFGFLFVFAAFALPVMLGGFAVALLFPGFPDNQIAIAAYQAFIYFLIFVLIGNAMYRAQRYRLSRTSWRGIRGALAGNPQAYGWTYFWTLALPFAAVAAFAGVTAWLTHPVFAFAVAVIAGLAALWLLPWRANKLQGLITNDTRFGDRPLTYDGTPGPLYKRYFFAWAGSALVYVLGAVAASPIITKLAPAVPGGKAVPPPPREVLTLFAIMALALLIVGLITAWYRASQMNHFARHTHFDGANFRLDASGPGLAWLQLSNWLITTLGLIAGLALGIAMAGVIGLTPQDPAAVKSAKDLGLLALLTLAAPVVLVTTATAAFAQFRSARYFMSRLKLDGPINLKSVLQSDQKSPKRGEGLAQMFDIDAF